MDQHTSVPDVLLIGLDTWERLTEEEQQWLKAAADESKIEQRKLWAASEKESLDAITKAGVKVIKPNKQPFEQQTKAILNMFKDDPEMITLIKNIKNTK